MAKKRAREADGAAEAPDKMVEDSESSDDDVSGHLSFYSTTFTPLSLSHRRRITFN